MPTLAIFQLYRGVNKFVLSTLTPTRPLEIKHTCPLNNRIIKKKIYLERITIFLYID
jgi:hypothetical protein